MTSALVCLPRSRGTILSTAARIDAEKNYLPEDLDGDGVDLDGDGVNDTKLETKCNFVAFAYCIELGVELPRVRARDQALWLAGPKGIAAGWKKGTAAEARAAVEIGKPTLVTWINPNPERSSHIGCGVPELPTLRWAKYAGGNFITQGGAQCFNNAPVEAGFGSRRVDWWIHE